MDDLERLDGHGPGKREGRLALVAGFAWTLSVVIASYIIGSAHTPAMRWFAAAILLLGVARVGLLMRRRLRQAEHLRQQLKVSNARLGVALRAAQMGTWVWDSKSDEIDLDAFERSLFGLSERNYRAAELVKHLHPDDIEVLKKAVGRALRDGTPVDYEFRFPDESFPDENHGWRWAEGSAMRYALSDETTCLVGVNRDISQRKQQELELAQAKQRAERTLAELERSRVDLDLALRSGQLGVWRSTRDADSEVLVQERPVDWDAHVRRIFGRGDNEQLMRRDFFEALHPEDRERVMAGLLEPRPAGKEYADQYRIVRPDGQVRVIAAALVSVAHADPDTGRHQIMTTGIVRDVTDEESLKADLRQKVREAQLTSRDLEQARTNLELALRSGQLGAWHAEFRDVSEAGDLGAPGLDDPISWDINVRRIYGFDAEEKITRRHFFETLHPEDRDRIIAHLAEVARHGSDYADQYRIVRPDGETRWVAVHAVFVWRDMPDGRRSRWMIGIAKDITQEETLKADLRQKALEAQRATEAKARFLAMMSHEIRTPMNGVIGMIELLLETPLGSEQQMMLASCKDSAFALLTVINDVLDFSKIEAGKLELDCTTVSLRRLAESVGEALGTHAMQRGIDLDIDVSPDVPGRVLGDRVRLRQVLTNLVGNAIKFTERGGVVVTVSMAPCEPADPRVRVRFEVTDTGMGMDEETVQNLFQPFHQADAATTRRFGGTGLGLSIVKYLTELMGGRIECESELSKGSRFSVVIPFDTATVERYDLSPPMAGVRVLAMAASELRRRILADQLSQFDAKVEFCDSMDELLARAQEDMRHRRIDLVFLDRGLSVSQCVGIQRRFDEIPELSELPLVIVKTSEPKQAELVPNATLINGNPLTRDSLVRGVLVALGRVSAPIAAIAEEQASGISDSLFREREEEAGRLILLAEDQPTNREVISRQLSRLGYACDVAEDGARAWKMLQSGRRYALLLTDCHMPGMDGYELTRRIRSKERDSGASPLPVVAITANVLRGEGERCMTLGMNGYLAKPLQISELKRTLAEFLLPAHLHEPADHRQANDRSSVPFGELAEMLSHDEGKLAHVLGIFERSTEGDSALMDSAYRAGDWRRVRELAHKLKSGCRQLGEEGAATALEAVERRADEGGDFDGEFASARYELQQVLKRVRDFLSSPRSRDGERV